MRHQQGFHVPAWKRLFYGLLLSGLTVCLLFGMTAVPVNAERGVGRQLFSISTTKVAEATVSGAADLGASIAISGDWAVVGAPGTSSSCGAAYLYQRNQGGAGNWGFVRALVNPSPDSNERFGWAVAVYADPHNPEKSTIAVGAKDESSTDKFAGAVYVYQRNQGGPDNWGLLQSLSTAPALIKGSRFGGSVLVQDNTLIVGAPYEGIDSSATNRPGSVFIYNRGQDGLWSQVGKVSGTEAGDRFGTAIASAGSILLVGTPNYTVDGYSKAGTTYIYERNALTGTWEYQANLYAPSPADGDGFGKSVSVSADTAVIGAPGQTNSGPTGSAYIFKYSDGTGTWNMTRRLTGPASSLFGSAAAIQGDLVAVGAPDADAGTGPQGVVSIFARNEGGIDNWGLAATQTLTTAANKDSFGSAVAVEGNMLLVGAPGHNSAGAAYFYTMKFALEVDLNGPAAAGFDYAATFIENDGPVSIVDPGATITYLSGSTLSMAAITLANCPDGSAEELLAEPDGATVITQDWIQYKNCELTIESPRPGEAAPTSDFVQVLRSVKYNNTSQAPATADREIQFIFTDGVEYNNRVTSRVTVVSVNDAPVVTLPAASVMDEDTDLIFSWAIAVSDVDAITLKVTLAATHGRITFPDTTGLALVSGSNGSALVEFIGTASAINAALIDAYYRPDMDYNGLAELTILVDDQGSSGVGGGKTDVKSMAITINPVDEFLLINGPVVVAVDEDLELSFSNMLNVQYSGAAPLLVSLEVSCGTFILADTTGLTFISGWNGAGAMVFTGSIAAINTALNGAVYRPFAHYSGQDALILLVEDKINGGSDERAVSIMVNPVNDAPVINAPTSANIDEDTLLAFPGNLTVSDADGIALQITLSVTNGVIVLSKTDGLHFTAGGNKTATMTFAGLIVSINEALNGAYYRPADNYNGPESLQIFVSDQVSTGLGGAKTSFGVIAINIQPVKEDPVITFYLEGPQPLRIFTDYKIHIKVISPAETPTGTVTVSLSGSPFTCSSVLDSSGDGTCKLLMDTSGSFILTAEYSGDNNTLEKSQSVAMEFGKLWLYMPISIR